MGKQIGSSLTVFTVSDLARSKQYYREVLGFDVTDWWAERDGLQGLALKLHQAPAGFGVRPNPPQPGDDVGVDVYAYVTDWAALDALYAEFRAKGATIAREPAVFADGGPWKEFIVADPDGYHLAFGGIDGGRTHSSYDPHIDSVIVWVRDLDAAVARYSQLLGIEVREQDRYGHLHLFRLDNGTHLMLDSNGMAEVPIPERGGPLFKVSAVDIDKAKDEAVRLGFEVVYGIARLPSVSFFNIRDADGNLITVSQDHLES
ncbi:VOC family protein [Cohnella nanjingensis]|uniref:VOC family protein n=1 Tax=Cohnella nanjingensis TaxID=1387779 RepID=A0A7X0RR96_9BACL|nr:VOC family protein [Cohnella nanjingensis]MBB6671056.1 VOC family protein [Cohnella nanjingensis]